MPRVKRGTHRRQHRKKVLKLTKGYYGTKSKLYRSAKESADKALSYAYRDRRARKLFERGVRPVDGVSF